MTLVTPEFQGFPKIPRLNRGITITEKLDGTNAAVGVIELDVVAVGGPTVELENGTVVNIARVYPNEGEIVSYFVYAQSRTRLIVPGDDNYGFALWTRQHAAELAELGPGVHFGEWWGVGINRGYDLHERRFSLFNTSRWGVDSETPAPPCCSVVPVLGELDTFDSSLVEDVGLALAQTGSIAAPGFKDPEGIVVFHKAANSCFKWTFDGDGHKSASKTRRGRRGGS